MFVSDPYYTCRCDDCEEYENVIYYTEQQRNDTNYDAYRNFNANNYFSLSGGKGRLTRLFTDNSGFYAHTTESIQLIRYQQGQLNLESNIGLVGAPDLLVNPIVIADGAVEGSLGLQHTNHAIQTSRGYYWFDAKEQRLYQFRNGQPTAISDIGLRNFFKEYGKICKEAGCCDDERNTGIGSSYLLGLDLRNERLLFTKNDLSECGQWTLSFDLRRNIWISFHSYIPDFYLWNREHLFSVKNNQIWIHDDNKCEYNRFYGEDAPIKLEFIARQENNQSFKYYSSILDTQSDQCVGEDCNSWLCDRHTTFDSISLTNKWQGTGTIKLDLKDDYEVCNEDNLLDKITERKGRVFVTRENSEFRFGDLQDYTKSREKPLFLSEQCDTCCSPFKKVNEDNFDCEGADDQSFENNIIKGRVLIYRLSWTNTDLHKNRFFIRSVQTRINEEN